MPTDLHMVCYSFETCFLSYGVKEPLNISEEILSLY
jgi:hypothetical protein